MVTCRLGIYDGTPYPYGWGTRMEDGAQGSAPAVDLSEPIELVKRLHGEYGIDLINLTMGNPYVTTHVARPFDAGKYEPEEHPLIGIARMADGISEVKRAVPDMIVYGTAPSYLRQYADLYTAGAVEQGMMDGMLFGRMAFADPDFARQIIQDGRIDPGRVCLTCGKCGDLIRSHKPTGCVVRNYEVYGPFYREFLEEKKSLPENFRG